MCLFLRMSNNGWDVVREIWRDKKIFVQFCYKNYSSKRATNMGTICLGRVLIAANMSECFVFHF